MLFTAFLFLLLVALSLPIIKTIYVVKLTSNAVEASPLSIATQLRFGVWGVCALGALDGRNSPGICIGPKLGYDVPDYFAQAIKVSPAIIQAVQKGLIAVLILHPIAAGLATLSFLSSLFLTSHAFSIVSLIITIVTALVSSIVLAVDIALVVVADSKVQSLGDLHVKVSFGNAVWMILVAVMLTWGAVISLSARACYCLGVRRHRVHDGDKSKKEKTNEEKSSDEQNRNEERSSQD